MSLYDLTITLVSSGNTIHDPLSLSVGSAVTIRATNHGTEDLSNLGVYVVVSNNLGEVDYPSDQGVESDFQDLLTWGEDVIQGAETQGGLKLTLDQGVGAVDKYIGRSQGSKLSNKIDLVDIAAGTSEDIILELESPPGAPTRRLYVDIVIA